MNKQNRSSSPAPVQRIVGRVLRGYKTDSEAFSIADDAIWDLIASSDDAQSVRESYDAIIDYIVSLRSALINAREWLPYHEPDHPEYAGGASDAGRAVRIALNPSCGCSPPNVRDHRAGRCDVAKQKKS